MRGPLGPAERPHRHRLLEALGSARRQRLPVPGTVPPHVLQGKPQVNGKSKVQCSNIQQPATIPDQDPQGKQ